MSEIIRKHDRGTDLSRVTVDKQTDFGAVRRQGETKWEAFATFGREGWNDKGYETEAFALDAAYTWVLAQIFTVSKGLAEYTYSE